MFEDFSSNYIEFDWIFRNGVGFFLLYRGCPCRHGRQRRAVGGGGQPGQRVDPQTGLQEHTRYSELTEHATLKFCCLGSFVQSVICFFVRSDVREGVCPGEWCVLGQEENQSSEEESGPHLPAGFVV